MEKSLYDQSSMKSHGVVHYSSSYGGFLFRSPNSPPDSPSLSPPPSIASLNHLFLNNRFNHGSRSPIYCSSPAGFFQQPQPPLLPLPRSTTLPAIPAAKVRSRRRNTKRKGKVFSGARKETSPPPINVKEDLKPMIADKEDEKREIKLNEEEEEEEEIVLESVYSLSPPPSSLPFPTFSLTRAKASSKDGVNGGSVAGYCIA